MRFRSKSRTKRVVPVRISNGTVIKAPHIVTDSDKDDEAIEEAKKYSGLSRFNSWIFLIKNSKTNRQIENILKYSSHNHE